MKPKSSGKSVIQATSEGSAKTSTLFTPVGQSVIYPVGTRLKDIEHSIKQMATSVTELKSTVDLNRMSDHERALQLVGTYRIPEKQITVPVLDGVTQQRIGSMNIVGQQGDVVIEDGCKRYISRAGAKRQ